MRSVHLVIYVHVVHVFFSFRFSFVWSSFLWFHLIFVCLNALDLTYYSVYFLLISFLSVHKDKVPINVILVVILHCTYAHFSRLLFLFLSVRFKLPSFSVLKLTFIFSELFFCAILPVPIVLLLVLKENISKCWKKTVHLILLYTT